MTKAELTEKLAGLTGLSKKDADKALDGFVEICGEAMQNNEQIALRGFGTLKVVDRPARKGRNPQTGQEIQIPAGKKVKFAPSGLLLGGRT